MQSAEQLITIIAPCHNENIAVIKFLDILEQALQPLPYRFSVVIVDDYSTDDTLERLLAYKFQSLHISLTILHLKFNMGHQGAIYQGLLYAQRTVSDHFIIMDSDGEDTPSAIPELLEHQDQDIVHVVRGKRRESLSFQLSYILYKLLFRTVTGREMNFGNFSLINRRILESAVHNNFHHFAAWLSRQKGSRQYVIYARDKRIDGRSSMSFNNLVHHAFRSLVEYGEDLLGIFLKCFVLIIILFVFAISNILYQKFIAHTAIPGWTSVTIIGLLNMAILSIGFFIIGILLLNLTRKNAAASQPVYEVITPEPNDNDTHL